MSVPYTPQRVILLDVGAVHAPANPEKLDEKLLKSLSSILTSAKVFFENKDIRLGSQGSDKSSLSYFACLTIKVAETEQKSVYRFMRKLFIRYPELQVSFILAELDGSVPPVVYHGTKYQGSFTSMTDPYRTTKHSLDGPEVILSFSGDAIENDLIDKHAAQIVKTHKELTQ